MIPLPGKEINIEIYSKYDYWSASENDQYTWTNNKALNDKRLL